MKKPKAKTPELAFEEIAADVIQQAESIKCPFSTFVEGLRTIRSEVTERLRQAESELDAMETPE